MARCMVMLVIVGLSVPCLGGPLARSLKRPAPKAAGTPPAGPYSEPSYSPPYDNAFPRENIPPPSYAPSNPVPDPLVKNSPAPKRNTPPVSYDHFPSNYEYPSNYYEPPEEPIFDPFEHNPNRDSFYGTGIRIFDRTTLPEDYWSSDYQPDFYYPPPDEYWPPLNNNRRPNWYNPYGPYNPPSYPDEVFPPGHGQPRRGPVFEDFRRNPYPNALYDADQDFDGPADPAAYNSEQAEFEEQYKDEHLPTEDALVRGKRHV